MLTPNEFLLVFADPRVSEDADNKEFKAALETDTVADGERVVADVVPPREMQELFQVAEVKKESKITEDSLFAKVKVKRVKVSRFDKIWSTDGTTARSPVTIWAPRLVSSWSKLQICIGHYCTTTAGSAPEPSANSPFFIFELVDTSTARFSGENLRVVADRLLPFPTKYTQIWKKELNTNSLYVWKPVAPSDGFVALGMICTTDAKEPSVNLTRCIPSGWVHPTKYTPQRIWDDSGTGGKKGSLWLADHFGLLTAVSSYEQPEGPFYELWKDEFYASDRVSEVKWDHDDNATTCYLCSKTFTMFLRRHHCRICGHIFCQNCSKYQVVLTTADGKVSKKVRACEVCKDAPVLPELPTS